jgi:transcriptional regulator with XRE-family HTH domain
MWGDHPTMVASMFTAASDALAAAVVELRKRAGLTQRQLAEALGREQNLVARIETGQRRVDLVEWVGICRACEANPEVEISKLVRRILALVPTRRRGR